RHCRRPIDFAHSHRSGSSHVAVRFFLRQGSCPMSAALAAQGMPAAAPVAAPPVVAFGPRIVIGLLGVLLAVLVAGFNENVTKVALADIRGAMGIGHDEGSWLIALYAAPSVCAMAFAP